MPNFTTNRKVVREILAQRIGQVRKQTGLPDPVIRAIRKAGRIDKDTYNLFRRTHHRICKETLIDNKVHPKVAVQLLKDPSSITRRETAPLTLPQIREIARITRKGIPLENALNYQENLEKTPMYQTERGRADLLEQIDYEAQLINENAELIVNNNGFTKQWIDEGKKNFSGQRITNNSMAIAHMKEIMAYARPSRQDWDRYIKERSTAVADNWQPRIYKKKKGQYVPVVVPQGDPKYGEYVRRDREGRITRVDQSYHTM